LRLFELPETPHQQDHQAPQASDRGDKYEIHEKLLRQMDDRSLLIDA